MYKDTQKNSYVLWSTNRILKNILNRYAALKDNELSSSDPKKHVSYSELISIKILAFEIHFVSVF